jgi:triosephosphate isomerase (TIM)
MRKPILAGNWKMNKTPAQAALLARELLPLLSPYGEVESVVCPPHVALPAVAEALRGSAIGIGAQNVFWAEAGAYTGEVAANMLVGLARYVIVGHSERRQYFGETDESVNKKIKAVLANGLQPIVCVGENLEQNEAGLTDGLVSGQVRAAFSGVAAAEAARAVIAYEPVWAIGTGRTATPAQASLAHSVIREAIGDSFGPQCAAAVRILYGGSVTLENVDGLIASHDIDGALVGGASLKADSFARIVRVRAG